MPTKKIRVTILDDHQTILDGYRFRLGNSPRVEIVATIRYGDELPTTLQKYVTDVLLLDVTVPVSADNPNPYPILHVIPDLLQKLGGIYGEMIQIHDDMHDAMETPANPDWVQGRSPLPILFASLVSHPEQKRFLALVQNITEPAALQEAQDILIRWGAISYCAD